MANVRGGGVRSRKGELRQSTWDYLAWKFEAGTPAIAESIGEGAAVDYLTDLGMENVRRHEQEITRYAIEQLRSVPGLTIYGPDAEHRTGVTAFTLGDIHPHDLSSIFTKKIAVPLLPRLHS